ncbi:MAG: DUF2238 domain-containing protein [Candidatus Sumerlaeia bacterium]|nr:DUF2238 domain-containing protein [Candidatus Sumerlaeia bacterium]
MLRLHSACWFWHQRSTHPHRFPLILISLYILLWIILSINVRYFDDWKMENYLTVPFVLVLLATFRRFPLSNISYTLIFIYMTLHIIGTHYTYSEVPFGFWLQNTFHLSRNHYDRIIHFLFGLLMAYPVREVAVRIGNFEGFWSLYFPVDFVLAFSAIYELIEYGIAVIFGGDLGIAYLGTQGDVWDAQKDMLLAFIGSVIAMVLTALVLWYYNKRYFMRTLRESLRVKSPLPLGGDALEEYKNK